MGDKYFVYVNGEHGSPIALAFRFNGGTKGQIIGGGYVRDREWIYGILLETFGVNAYDTSKVQTSVASKCKLRVCAPITMEAWDRGMLRLQSQYHVEPVTAFGRLMR